MRLFVAIELDEAAKAAVGAEQRRVRQALSSADRVKWTAPEQMHVTLAFLGEVPEARLPDLIAELRPRLDVAPFRLSFGGLGVFPQAGAPRVLWLGASEGSAEVAVVQAMVAARVARAGITLESRPFHAHVTLARWRQARHSDARRLRMVTSAAPGQEAAHIEVDHVTLFQSRTSSKGSAYTMIAQARLTGEPDRTVGL